MAQFIIPAAPKGTVSLPFEPDKPWLAPLAGYSDLPFRLLCRHFGAFVCTTEMISAKGLQYKSPGTGRLLLSTPEDVPLIVQLFGSDEESLRFAVRLLKEKGYSFFDLNIGCSVPKVLRQNAGAGMLRDKDNLLRCAKAMLEEAGLGHVGFKLRSGLDETKKDVPDLALALEALGAGWITLHPRTAKQGFQGRADWSEIRTLARVLTIPVVASGDLLTAEDGVRCLDETGANTLMYARGAIHSPMIFTDHASLIAGGTVLPRTGTALKEMLFMHLDLVHAHDEGRNQTAKMRGILAAYVRGLPNARSLRIALCRCTRWEDLYTLIDEGIAN